jgi:predicted TIM-barrel fold metal-dependent hydrolase
VEPYIDAHSHVWTPDVGHYPLAEGFRVEDMQPKSFTAQQLLETCRPNGVGRVNLIQMSFYGFDNSYMLDMIKLYPDRFVGTAIVDPFGQDPARAMRELRPRGVRAFRIQSVMPYVQSKEGVQRYEEVPPERWLEPEGYKAMFAEAARSRQVLSCLIDPRGFAEVDRMCRAFPDTPVVIDHFGRVGVDGTIRDGELDALCALAKHPNVSVKTGAFYALGAKKPPYLDLAPMIRRVLQAYGPKRCMWESDCPFQVVHHTYADSISLIRDKLDFLTDDDRQWLLGKTAETLLFRQPS